MSYTDFDASDAAVDSMNGQFLMNKAISVQYAFKKDGKGERHGTEAERTLATQAKKNNALPSSRPPGAPMGFGTPGFQGAYQGQFAGALAAPPPPPPGFAPQQTILPPISMGMGGPPPGMVGMGQPPMAPPPSGGMPMYGGGFPPPPPPGFGAPYGGPPTPSPQYG